MERSFLNILALTNAIAAADHHAHNGGEVPAISAIADISRSELPADAPRFLSLFPQQSQSSVQTVTTKMIKPVTEFHSLPPTSATNGPMSKTVSRKSTTSRSHTVMAHSAAVTTHPIIVNTEVPAMEIMPATPTTSPSSFPFISGMPDTGDILIVSDDDGDTVVKSTNFDRVTSVRTTRMAAESEETLLSGPTKIVPALPHDRNFGTNGGGKELANIQLITATDERNDTLADSTTTFSLIDFVADTSSTGKNVDRSSSDGSATFLATSELPASGENKWVAPMAFVEQNHNETAIENEEDEDDSFIIAQFKDLENDTITKFDHYNGSTVMGESAEGSGFTLESKLWNSMTAGETPDYDSNSNVNNCATEMTTLSAPQKILETDSRNLIAGGQMNLSTELSTAKNNIANLTTRSVELLENPVSAVTLHERTYDDYFRLLATLTRVDTVTPPQSSHSNPPRTTTTVSSSVTVVGTGDSTDVVVEDSLWPDPAPLLQHSIVPVKISRSSKSVNERRRLRAIVNEREFSKAAKVDVGQPHINSSESINKQPDELNISGNIRSSHKDIFIGSLEPRRKRTDEEADDNFSEIGSMSSVLMWGFPVGALMIGGSVTFALIAWPHRSG